MIEGQPAENNALLVAFMILCIIGIILSLVFILTGKKFGKKNRLQSTELPGKMVTKDVL